MKKFVNVIGYFNKKGDIKPLYIVWDDGSKYPIDKVVQVIPAATIHSGGMGLRYTCKIGREFRYLFLEEGKWFVEKVNYEM